MQALADSALGPLPGAETSPGAAAIWDGVDRLIDRAPSLADLYSHKLELFAARRWRSSGIPVPADLVEQERRAAIAVLAAPVLLERVRAAYDGEIVALKGIEVAARYPDPGLRGFRDLDLLVADAPAAQAALAAAGFVEVGEPALYADIHHLRPLRWPGLPLLVEVHSRPKWIDGPRPAPTARELLAAAAPGADGVGQLPPAHHALLLAVHSWAHEPLRRLRDVIDVAVMAEAAGRAEVEALAREWGIDRLWRVTIAAADAVLNESRRPWALRLWAQNLEKARERTVLENHMQRWLSDFSIMPPGAAAARVPATVRREIGRKDGEAWGDKLVRSVRAVRNTTRRRSEHEDGSERLRRR